MVKKVKKFNYKKDLKKEWKKKKEKLKPKVNTDGLGEFWDQSKSIEANYRELGLSIDPNRTLTIPKAKDVLSKQEFMSLDEAKQQAEQQQRSRDEASKPSKAIKHLEELASKAPEKVYNLNEDDILLVFFIFLLIVESFIIAIFSF